MLLRIITHINYSMICRNIYILFSVMVREMSSTQTHAVESPTITLHWEHWKTMGGSSALKEEEFGELELCGILSSCCMSPMIFITCSDTKNFPASFQLIVKLALIFVFVSYALSKIWKLCREEVVYTYSVI